MLKRHKTATPWLPCLSAALFFMYVFIVATIPDSISIFLMRDFSMSASALANLSAFYFYGNLMMLIPAGLILDRVSVKPILCGSLMILLVGVLLFFLSTRVEWVLLARFLCGVSGGFAFLCCLRLALKLFTTEKLSLAIGVMITVGYMGGIISHYPIIWLTGYIGWRLDGVVLFFLGLIILAINLIVLPGDTKNTSPTDRTRKDNQTIQFMNHIKAVILNPYQWIGALYTTFLNLPVILFGALWSSIFLQQAKGLTIYNASLVSSLTFLGLMIGSPFVGLYTKSTKRISHVLFIGSLLSCLLIVALIYASSALLELGLIFFFLGFFSSTQSVGYTIVLSNIDNKIASLASSLMSIVIMGGGTLIKIFFGLILDWFWDGRYMSGKIRLYSSGDYRGALLFVGFFFVLSFIIASIYYMKTKSTHRA